MKVFDRRRVVKFLADGMKAGDHADDTSVLAIEEGTPGGSPTDVRVEAKTARFGFYGVDLPHSELGNLDAGGMAKCVDIFTAVKALGIGGKRKSGELESWGLFPQV